MNFTMLYAFNFAIGMISLVALNDAMRENRPIMSLVYIVNSFMCLYLFMEHILNILEKM